MIGGNAYKPDDILRAKNGKTIEVKKYRCRRKISSCRLFMLCSR